MRSCKVFGETHRTLHEKVDESQADKLFIHPVLPLRSHWGQMFLNPVNISLF